MKKPIKEDFGWENANGFENEPSGFVLEGGEEAFEEAMQKWQFMQDNGLCDEMLKQESL
jgi:hypothetical protein